MSISLYLFNTSQFRSQSFTPKLKLPKISGIVVESSLTQTASQYVETHIDICRPESIAFFDKNPKIINMVSFII